MHALKLNSKDSEICSTSGYKYKYICSTNRTLVRNMGHLFQPFISYFVNVTVGSCQAKIYNNHLFIKSINDLSMFPWFIAEWKCFL